MGDIGFCRCIWTLGCVLALLSMRAYAQPLPGSQVGRAWAVGVSQSEQQTALRLYVEGNREFAQARFAQALARYKEAIRHWDHPAIRFNIAVCLIHLDQPLEAKGNLERSLTYGDRALGADLYGQGLTYRKLLDAQLAFVKITCQEPGTQVTLDGKFLLTGPGSKEESLLPGEHQAVATRTGFLTASKALVLVAGKRTTHEIRPLEPRAVTRMVRRWEPWRPWAVLVGGSALVGLGALSYVASVRRFADYDRLVAKNCADGCNAEMLSAVANIGRIKDSAVLDRVFAASLFSTGGAVVVAGVIGLILNQQRLQLETNHAQPVVQPTHGGATLTMGWRF
jgi:hypothetical protein